MLGNAGPALGKIANFPHHALLKRVLKRVLKSVQKDVQIMLRKKST